MTGVNDQAAFLASLSKRITALERFASIDRSGATFDGSHVLTGDPASPPAGLQVDQLLWDGDSTLVSSGTDWVAVTTFANSWANLGSGQVLQYRRRGDMVDLRGKITGGTLGVTAFTLPVGFRPPDWFTAAATLWNGSAQAATIGITSSGAALIYAAANNDIGFSISFSVTA